MPFELFKTCHHLAYFMELMDRMPDGKVLWDDETTDIVDGNMAAAEYEGLQRGWFEVNMELPKAFVDSLLKITEPVQLNLFEV